MWEIAIVAIVGLGIYVLTNIFGDKNKPPPPARGQRGGEPVQRRSAPDLDRFLQEVQRRRKNADERREQRNPEEPTAQSERRPAPAPVASPAPARQQRSLRAPKPAPAPKSTPARKRQVEPEIVPLRTAVVVVESEPTPVKPSAEAFPEAVAVVLPNADGSNKTATYSPAVAQLLNLLRNPATIATGVMLQEILGEPRCKRRQR